MAKEINPGNIKYCDTLFTKCLFVNNKIKINTPNNIAITTVDSRYEAEPATQAKTESKATPILCDLVTKNESSLRIKTRENKIPIPAIEPNA